MSIANLIYLSVIFLCLICLLHLAYIWIIHCCLRDVYGMYVHAFVWILFELSLIYQVDSLLKDLTHKSELSVYLKNQYLGRSGTACMLKLCRTSFGVLACFSICMLMTQFYIESRLLFLYFMSTPPSMPIINDAYMHTNWQYRSNKFISILYNILHNIVKIAERFTLY